MNVRFGEIHQNASSTRREVDIVEESGQTPARIVTVRLNDEYFTNPHAVVAGLLRQGPIHRFESGNGTAGWFIVGHRAGQSVLADSRFEKSRSSMTAGGGRAAGGLRGLLRRLQRWASGVTVSHMLSVDGADHTRLRHVAAGPFTQKAVRGLTPEIVRRAEALVDALDVTRPADVVSKLAFPLPMSVICGILGLPDKHAARLGRASEVLGDVLVAERSELRAATGTFLRLLVPPLLLGVILGQGDGLLRQLAQAVRRREISFFEAVSTATLLVIAGHETTSSLIAHAALRVVDSPELRRKITAGDVAALDSLIEETARLDPPLPVTTLRYTSEAVELEGVTIAAGDWVMVSLLGANLDPARVTEPAQFDAGRHPNPHMSFGYGIHYCVGSHLARAEARAAITALLTRYPDIALDVDRADLEWRRSVVFRQVRQLPVTLGRPTGRPRSGQAA
ncbi:Cytochrome P450 107B1 (plasmid) [Tsukamurella tyrosinosolvens]|uniref:Cytochrome P450 n=2 Tax=Tsukamurella tyrosinosolvens TaxID=57704 RepID=A0A1H4V7E6_TSUTY|nr:Cytochrome P450 [Tsukamurella tyrosinosolvens]VEH90636.1 Cytochrome P450 107B1 [Tsukamurella tyrosinosolvens]